VDELSNQSVRHVIDVPATGVGGYLRVEGDLEEDVAEFVSDPVGFARFDRLDELVCLFKEMARQRPVGLLQVPRTTIGRAQRCLHLDQIQQPLPTQVGRHRALGTAEALGPLPGTLFVHDPDEPAGVGATGLTAGLTELVLVIGMTP